MSTICCCVNAPRSRLYITLRGAVGLEIVELLLHEAAGARGRRHHLAPRDGDGAGALLDVEHAVVGLRERAVIHPDAGGDSAAVTNRDEVPVVRVVGAARAFVPLPQLVEAQVAQDEVRAVLDVELGMADGRAVAREDRQAVEVLDVEQGDAAGDQRRMFLGRRCSARSGLLVACSSVPTSFQPMLRSFMISMTFTGFALDAFASLQRGHELGGGGHLAIARVRCRECCRRR